LIEKPVPGIRAGFLFEHDDTISGSKDNQDAKSAEIMLIIKIAALHINKKLPKFWKLWKFNI
jgi:hypothetical protein